ncbi:MAG TPA: FkbM family methyltransferase [Vicinamibacterales bacterium]|nr:FkbM family methyltransferase [Vicinamibacterales bacterium]
MTLTTGRGSQYREASWLERIASGSAKRAPAWMRRPLKRAYEALLAAVAGDHLISRLPGGETLRVDAAYRQLAWNPEEYAALRAAVRPGATVIDVGANVGAYTLLFATWAGPDGRVFAFEPATASRTGLVRHLALNGLAGRVTVRSEAVSDGGGTRPFIDAGTHGDNRIVPAGTNGASVVPAVSLDDFCADLAPPPDVIKIDVEGAELAVLRGARRTIAARGASLALFVELHPAIWPSLGITRETIEEELSRQRLVVEPLPGVADPWTVQGVCVRLRPA